MYLRTRCTCECVQNVVCISVANFISITVKIIAPTRFVCVLVNLFIWLCFVYLFDFFARSQWILIRLKKSTRLFFWVADTSPIRMYTYIHTHIHTCTGSSYISRALTTKPNVLPFLFQQLNFFCVAFCCARNSSIDRTELIHLTNQSHRNTEFNRKLINMPVFTPQSFLSRYFGFGCNCAAYVPQSAKFTMHENRLLSCDDSTLIHRFLVLFQLILFGLISKWNHTLYFPDEKQNEINFYVRFLFRWWVYRRLIGAPNKKCRCFHTTQTNGNTKISTIGHTNKWDFFRMCVCVNVCANAEIRRYAIVLYSHIGNTKIKTKKNGGLVRAVKTQRWQDVNALCIHCSAQTRQLCHLHFKWLVVSGPEKGREYNKETQFVHSRIIAFYLFW